MIALPMAFSAYWMEQHALEGFAKFGMYRAHTQMYSTSRLDGTDLGITFEIVQIVKRKFIGK